MVIQWKMDKIDQRLDELYKNWHAEYRDAVSAEDCEEIKTVLQTLPGKVLIKIQNSISFITTI